jgi:hypothetical protein
MDRTAATALAERLELDMHASGVCLPCLTFVAFPLDSGSEREARSWCRRMSHDLWADGLDLPAMLALETAKRDGVPRADEAIQDVRRRGARSPVIHAIVWRLAQQMVEEIRASKVVS